MEFDLIFVIDVAANVGVVAGIVFLALELRQNNKHLAAQARYALRQYRSDIADSIMQPHILQAMHKLAAGEDVSPVEKSAALMAALKGLELWEWQYGEYAAGMLPKDELPVGSWRIWYAGQGQAPMPIREVWAMRRGVMQPAFVRFFEDNVINQIDTE